MFEYKGETFTFEQIEKRAKQKGMSVDAYLMANSEIKDRRGPEPFKMPENAGSPITTSADIDVVSETIEDLEPEKGQIRNLNFSGEGTGNLKDNIWAGTRDEKIDLMMSAGMTPELVSGGWGIGDGIANEDLLENLNLPTLQEQWLSENGEIEQNLDIDQGINIEEKANDNGIIFLDKDDKAVRNLEINLRGAKERKDLNMIKDLEIKLANARKKAGTGERLFDPTTGKIESLETISEQGKVNEENAKVMSIANDLDSLKKIQATEYYELIALSKKALQKWDALGEERTIGEKIVGPVKGYFTEDTYGYDQKALTEIAQTGTLPPNLTHLPGEHPLALAFNKKLDRYLTLNRAIQLNSDPATTERTNELTKNLNRLSKNLGNKDFLGTDDTDASVALFKDIIAENNLEYKDSIMINARTAKTVTDGIAGVTVDLAGLAAAIAVTRKLPGFAQAETGLASLSKFLTKVGPSGKGSGIYGVLINTTFGLNKGSSVIKEMVTLGLADKVGEALVGAEPVDPVFAAALGAGQSLSQQVMAKFLGKRIRFITPALASINKHTPKLPNGQGISYGEKYIQAIQGGVIGTGTMIVAEAVSLEVQSLREEGKHVEAEELLALGDIHHLIETYYSLRLIGSASGKLTGAIARDIKNMVTLTPSKRTQAAKILNISKNPSEELIPITDSEGVIKGAKKSNRIEEIDQAEQQALENLKKEYMPEGEGTSETFADGSYTKKVKEIKDSAQMLRNDYELVIAKQQVQKDEENAASNVDLYVTTNRIKKDLPLDALDYETLAKTDVNLILERLGQTNNKTVREAIKNVHTGATRLINIVDKLGFKGGTKQRSEAIDALSAYSKISSEIIIAEKMMKSNPGLKPALESQIERLKVENEKILKKFEDIRLESEKLAAEEITGTKNIFEQHGIKNTIELSPEEFIKKVKELEPGKNPDIFSDGVIDRATGKIYINREGAKKNMARGVTVHEQGHAMVQKALRGKDGKITPEGLAIIREFISKLNPTEKRLIEERIEKDYKYNVEGKEKAFEEYAEEYVTIFGDLIRDKKIKFKSEIEESDAGNIKSGIGLKNLIRRLNAEVDAGKLSEDIVTAIKSESTGKGIDSSRNIAKIKSLETELRDVRNAEKERIQSFLKRAKEIEKAQPEVAKRMRESVGEMSNKEGIVVRDIADEYKVAIKNTVLKLLKSKPALLDTPTYQEYKTLDQKIDAIVKQTIPEIIKHIERFDFKKNDNLDAYINSYIVKKIGTATGQKEFRKEEFTDRLDDKAFKIASETDGPIEIIKSELSKFKKTIKPTNEQRVEILQKALNTLVKNLNKIDTSVKGKPRTFYTDAKKQVEKELFKLVKNRLNTLNSKGYKELMKTKQGLEVVHEIDLQTMTNSLKGKGKGFEIFLEPVLDKNGKQETYSKEEANKLGIPYDKAGSGPKKWKKKPISDFIDKDGNPSGEFLDWVLDRKNSTPRIDGKKDAIAKALAGNLGLDAMMGGAKTPIFEIKKDKYINLLKEAGATPDQIALIKTDAFLGKLADKISRNKNISFSIRKQTENFMTQLEKLSKDQSRIQLFKSQTSALQDIFNRILPGEKKVLDILNNIDKVRVKLEAEAADRIMLEEGITYEEALLRINQEIKDYKGLRKKKKVGQLPHDPLVQTRILQLLIPKGMKLGDLSKDVQQQIYSEMQGGNTRFIIDGRKITFKDWTKELKAKLKKEGRDWKTPMSKSIPAPKEATYADLFEVVYGKDAIKGTKTFKGDVKEVLAAAKFYSNWGNISRQFEKIISKNLKEYGDSDKARLEIKKEIENFMTKEGVDSKDNPLFTIDQTIAANRVMLERKYDGLIDMFMEKRSKKTLGKIIDVLQPLTNQATSISKGNIPITLINIFSQKGPKYNEKGKELKQDKIRHNEHLLEFFQMNSRFIDLLDNYRNKKITAKELRDKTKNLIRNAEQASTSEFQRYGKDKSGPSISDALSRIEFLFKGGKAKDVVTIGSSRQGLTLAEAISKTLNPKQKQIIKNTSNSKLTTEGILVKQRVQYPKDYKQVKVNNEKIAKIAGVSHSISKKMNQSELFDKLKEIDKENAKKIKEGFESKDLSKEFNEILEQSSGVKSEKQYSDIRAKSIGSRKRNWQFFIPDRAADLNGLIDVTLGKGKKGDTQRKWYKENLIDPFNKAEDALIRDRVALTSGFKGLKKQLKITSKDLRKEAIDGFTFEQAIRVYTWNKQRMKVEGLSKRDLKDLTEIIEKNPELNAFSEQLIELGKGEGYPAPHAEWLAGSIATDLRVGLNKNGRAKYLNATGYTENVNKIYSKENLNKLEAVYGVKYKKALENMLGRMKTGRNRKPSGSDLENRALDWINNANGVTMFLNARSAVLQTISSINYINWTDNNPLKAGKAIANVKQYSKDFMDIMNSDYLVDRRNGLKLNVSESEIADAAKGSTNSAKGIISYLLSKGFVFTRIADSFAIASGGATFYRNRINTYKKQGLSEAQAKEKAFKDFREISETSQQSANVSKISMEQATALGRLVLAFANTPMQYARLQKSAILDLANGRGDYKTNISKVMYYGFVQNLMFNALQNAMFTNIWEDNPDEDKEETKRARVVNGMADSILRGMGIQGAGIAALKNVLLKIKHESNQSRPDYKEAAMEVFDFIPPIDSKMRKLRKAGEAFEWDSKKMKTMGLMDINNPAYLAGANIISAATNFPIDRIIKKTQNMNGVLTDEMEMWQRIARFAGWSQWEIGPFEPKKKSKKKKAFGKTLGGKKFGTTLKL